MSSNEFAVLVERLAWPEAGARRVAILDLIRTGDERATEALIEHLPRERDERASLVIIRHLGRIGTAGALGPLWTLYADQSTPVRVAHAALVEHDRITGRRAGSQ